MLLIILFQSGPVGVLSTIYSPLLECLFPRPHGFLRVWSARYLSTQWSKQTLCRSLVFCFHSVLFSGALSCELQLPSSPWPSCPQLRESSVLSWTPRSCTTGQKPSWDWYWGEELASCVSCHSDPVLFCLMSRVLKTIVHVSGYLKWEGKFGLWLYLAQKTKLSVVMNDFPYLSI